LKAVQVFKLPMAEKITPQAQAEKDNVEQPVVDMGNMKQKLAS
jgi:hypothetical protein